MCSTGQQRCSIKCLRLVYWDMILSDFQKLRDKIQKYLENAPEFNHDYDKVSMLHSMVT